MGPARFHCATLLLIKWFENLPNCTKKILNLKVNYIQCNGFSPLKLWGHYNRLLRSEPEGAGGATSKAIKLYWCSWTLPSGSQIILKTEIKTAEGNK
jgi:hypothetical protein